MIAVKNNTNYNFSHRILKNLIFTHKKEIIQSLISAPEEKSQKLLQLLWDESYDISKSERGAQNIIKEQFHNEIQKGNINENTLYWILKLPEPKHIGHCKYIGLLYHSHTSVVKYFTLEKSLFKNSYMLCGWNDKSHINFGQTSDCDFETFKNLICRS